MPVSGCPVTCEEKDFEGDRPLVASTDEGPEYLLEVDRAGAEITAMRIPGMEVAEEIAGLNDGLLDVGLLDVHVIAVEMDLDVRSADPLAKLQPPVRPC